MRQPLAPPRPRIFSGPTTAPRSQRQLPRHALHSLCCSPWPCPLQVPALFASEVIRCIHPALPPSAAVSFSVPPTATELAHRLSHPRSFAPQSRRNRSRAVPAPSGSTTIRRDGRRARSPPQFATDSIDSPNAVCGRALALRPLPTLPSAVPTLYSRAESQSLATLPSQAAKSPHSTLAEPPDARLEPGRRCA